MTSLPRQISNLLPLIIVIFLFSFSVQAENPKKGVFFFPFSIIQVKEGPKKKTPKPFIHLVEPGESLTFLSKLYKTDQEKIRKANSLTRKTVLAPGYKLIIPVKQDSGNFSNSFGGFLDIQQNLNLAQLFFQ